MWINVFPVWPPPSWISEWYRRVLPLTKDFLEFTQQKTWHTTLFYLAISRISGLFATCYHIAYFRWISPIKIANMTSCLLRSRDVKVMKSMLACREFICAQSQKKFLSYLFRQKSYTAKSALGVFPPICNIRVNTLTPKLPWFVLFRWKDSTDCFNRFRWTGITRHCCDSFIFVNNLFIILKLYNFNLTLLTDVIAQPKSQNSWNKLRARVTLQK